MTGAVLELPFATHTEAASTVVDQLEPAEQQRLLAQVKQLWDVAPPARPHAVGGKAMHVKVSSAGSFAWWGDGKAYRYLPCQPGGAPLPPIPPEWSALWPRFTGRDDAPDTALVMLVPGDADASIAWHAEQTEQDLSLPIVLVFLGRARWAVRRREGAPVSRCTLEPGAVVLLEGPTRMLEHSLERVLEVDDQLSLGTAPPPPPPPFSPHPSPLPAGARGLVAITLRIAGDPAARRVERRPAERTLTYDDQLRILAEMRGRST
jgi:DNA oxidative demethylase